MRFIHWTTFGWLGDAVQKDLLMFNGKYWQGMTRSLFQLLRREREFLSLNLVLWDANFFLPSRASSRDRESRFRQWSQEFLRITFIVCLLTNIFKYKSDNFSNFPKTICIFLLRNFNENLIFRDENKNIVLRASRWEREIENDFSRAREKKLSGFSRELPETGIPVTLWIQDALTYAELRLIILFSQMRFHKIKIVTSYWWLRVIWNV